MNTATFASKSMMYRVVSGACIATLLALFFILEANLFFLILPAIAWWVWHYKEQGFLFLLVISPILPMLKITHTLDPAGFIKDVVIITLFAGSFAYPLLQKSLPYRRNILLIPVLLLFGWATLSALRADTFFLGIVRLRDIVLYALLFFAVLHIDHSREIMKRRIVWFLASFVVVLLLGLWQWFAVPDGAVLRYDPVREIWIPRISSILAHPSIFGHYLITGLTVCVGIAISASTRMTRLLWTIATTIPLVYIYLTYSRGVWIGVAIALLAMGVVYGWNTMRRNVSSTSALTYVLLVGGVIVAVLLVSLRATPAGNIARSIFDPTYASNEERLIFMSRLIGPMTYAQALGGLGLGDVTGQQLRVVELEGYDIATGSGRAVRATKDQTLVDNQYLMTFVEMGLVGLILYGFIYWKVCASCVRTYIHKKSNIWQQGIALAGIGFFSAFIVQAVFIDIWGIFPTNMYFWIYAALISHASLSYDD